MAALALRTAAKLWFDSWRYFAIADLSAWQLPDFHNCPFLALWLTCGYCSLFAAITEIWQVCGGLSYCFDRLWLHSFGVAGVEALRPGAVAVCHSILPVVEVLLPVVWKGLTCVCFPYYL